MSPRVQCIRKGPWPPFSELPHSEKDQLSGLGSRCPAAYPCNDRARSIFPQLQPGVCGQLYPQASKDRKDEAKKKQDIFPIAILAMTHGQDIHIGSACPVFQLALGPKKTLLDRDISSRGQEGSCIATQTVHTGAQRWHLESVVRGHSVRLVNGSVTHGLLDLPSSPQLGAARGSKR